MRSRLEGLLAPFYGMADTAVILGSGLSALLQSIDPVESLSFEMIEGCSSPSVEGHPGKLLLVRERGSYTLFFAGRVHLYEGNNDISGRSAERSMENREDHPSSFAVRLASRLGCENLLLTQAAGSLRPELESGSWMLAGDIVSLPYRNNGLFPFQEKGLAEGRHRRLIAADFREALADAARDARVPLFDGTLYWTTGPCYETSAEAAMARLLGADAATMSPIPELVAALAAGLKAACLSWITNPAPNLAGEAVDHAGVVEMGQKGAATLLRIIRELPRRPGQL
ncbi:MAG: hypothetical protein JW814_03560 [Candidatus Krumholzibacteriota bacterium]|nr:hypothetical protein [Candidatus Krumholzibacteriota bacterium]